MNYHSEREVKLAKATRHIDHAAQRILALAALVMAITYLLRTFY